MEIYTSYFGNVKKLRAAGVKMISISRFNPRYVTVDADMKDFAPTAEMLKMSTADYDREYQKILESLDKVKVKDYFSKILPGAGIKAVALCCYEKNIDECHWKKVMEYLNDLGYSVTEFGSAEKKPAAPEATQQSMF